MLTKSIIRAGSNYPMVLVFDTNLAAGTTVTVPLGDTVDCVVDWGDGSSNSYTTAGDYTHTYSSNGIYTVKISGLLTTFGNGAISRPNLIKCLSFGDIGLTGIGSAFNSCANFIEAPTYLPSSITTMTGLFRDATSFNQNINSWDTSNITSFSGIFRDAASFNQDLSSWDLTNVTTTFAMFWGSAFNQDISSWDTSNLVGMGRMFSACPFNQDISSWDVSNVTAMFNMFVDNTAFNQDISSWDVSNVTNMNYMFQGATAFNQNLSSWITGLTSQPPSFSLDANPTFANNANNLKPFLSGGVTRINT